MLSEKGRLFCTMLNKTCTGAGCRALRVSQFCPVVLWQSIVISSSGSHCHLEKNKEPLLTPTSFRKPGSFQSSSRVAFCFSKLPISITASRTMHPQTSEWHLIVENVPNATLVAHCVLLQQSCTSMVHGFCFPSLYPYPLDRMSSVFPKLLLPLSCSYLDLES